MNENTKILIILLNVLGFLTFPVFYGSQILNTNPGLWVFVPDCQLAALLFAIALITKKDWLANLGFMISLKYGLWTIIALLTYINYYLTPTNTFSFFIDLIAHVLLVTQVVLLKNKIRFNKAIIPGLIFLILNDLSDYLLGTHPPLPDYSVPLMSIVTPLLTLGVFLTIYLITNKKKLMQFFIK